VGKPQVTGPQIKAARALLGWTVRELAEKAKIHPNTITHIEVGRYRGRDETLEAIRNSFEKAGIRFLKGGVIVQ
jgi:transcriptional regulator with XRE-family HTH domain